MTLNIFSAGVARKAVTATIDKWNAAHPQLPAVLTVDGSVDLIRRCLSGEPCDILILADDKIIGQMMMPDKASGYVVFAGNRMVVAANEGYSITTEDWKEKLLDPAATFDHHNPYADPGGYRAVMSMILADKLESGLAGRLLDHPGHFGMGTETVATGCSTEAGCEIPEIKYCFDYYTRAASRGAMIAELPEIMNLGNDALADEYASARFDVGGGNIVTATPICHALTIPATAVNAAAAREFAKLFLETDFASYGFVERRQVVGENVVE